MKNGERSPGNVSLGFVLPVKPCTIEHVEWIGPTPPETLRGTTARTNLQMRGCP